MNADGSGFQQLTSNTVPDLTPSWSPDGTQIAFQQGPVGRPQIFIMNSELDPDGPESAPAGRPSTTRP
jgi:Tol biopolymer transport system component